ncbi:MAG: hypothetical protein M3P44_08435 [Actinomycetota bacterium]|nr:hypothetical protein [Actinomycetota bacterium]
MVDLKSDAVLSMILNPSPIRLASEDLVEACPSSHQPGCDQRYRCRMCVQCAMVAAVGATGARSWLQNARLTWLTPRRLRRVTVGLCVVACVVSTLGVSGSSASRRPAGAAVAAQR